MSEPDNKNYEALQRYSVTVGIKGCTGIKIRNLSDAAMGTGTWVMQIFGPLLIYSHGDRHLGHANFRPFTYL